MDLKLRDKHLVSGGTCWPGGFRFTHAALGAVQLQCGWLASQDMYWAAAGDHLCAVCTTHVGSQHTHAVHGPQGFSIIMLVALVATLAALVALVATLATLVALVATLVALVLVVMTTTRSARLTVPIICRDTSAAAQVSVSTACTLVVVNGRCRINT